MEWLKIAVRRNTLLRAVTALLLSSTKRHEEARRESDPERAKELRSEGDADAEAHNEMWRIQHGEIPMQSVNGNSAPVQNVQITLPPQVEKAVSWLIPTFLALAIIIGACGVVMGIDISDRFAQQREFDSKQRLAERLADDREKRLTEEFTKLDRQSRMTELKLDDWTVVAHRAGLQLPGDYTRGPQGDLDAESFHIKKSKEK